MAPTFAALSVSCHILTVQRHTNRGNIPTAFGMATPPASSSMQPSAWSHWTATSSSGGRSWEEIPLGIGDPHEDTLTPPTYLIGVCVVYRPNPWADRWCQHRRPLVRPQESSAATGLNDDAA